jgi:site-specific DNA-cytosine methylase
VACEYSATVRDAFRRRGHDAWSCDLLPTEGELYWHYQQNLFDEESLGPLDDGPWDLIVAFPPCTHLAASGARWWATKQEQQAAAIYFVRLLSRIDCPRIAIENPVGKLSTAWRKPDQIIQPWQFGHGETKATCLWLKNLPKLKPTKIVPERVARVHRMPPGPNRWKKRSRTYFGIAEAMAEQWGSL